MPITSWCCLRESPRLAPASARNALPGPARRQRDRDHPARFAEREGISESLLLGGRREDWRQPKTFSVDDPVPEHRPWPNAEASRIDDLVAAIINLFPVPIERTELSISGEEVRMNARDSAFADVCLSRELSGRAGYKSVPSDHCRGELLESDLAQRLDELLARRHLLPAADKRRRGLRCRLTSGRRSNPEHGNCYPSGDGPTGPLSTHNSPLSDRCCGGPRMPGTREACQSRSHPPPLPAP
jgi:hypothetical protein